MAGCDGMERSPGPIHAMGLHSSLLPHLRCGTWLPALWQAFHEGSLKFWSPVRWWPRRKISFSFKASQVKLSLSLSRYGSQQNSGLHNRPGCPAETWLLTSFGLVLALLLVPFLVADMKGLAELVSTFWTHYLLAQEHLHQPNDIFLRPAWILLSPSVELHHRLTVSNEDVRSVCKALGRGDERTCKTDSTPELQMPFPHLQCFKAKV